MSSGWVDVYSLDESIEYYRDELRQIIATINLANSSASNGHSLITSATTMVDAHCNFAPVTYGLLKPELVALGLASSGFLGGSRRQH